MARDGATLPYTPQRGPPGASSLARHQTLPTRRRGRMGGSGRPFVALTHVPSVRPELGREDDLLFSPGSQWPGFFVPRLDLNTRFSVVPVASLGVLAGRHALPCATKSTSERNRLAAREQCTTDPAGYLPVDGLGLTAAPSLWAWSCSQQTSSARVR